MPLVTNDNESGLGERGSNLGPGGAGGTNYPTGQTNPPSSIPSSIPPDVVTFVNGTRVTNPDRNVPPETPNNIPPAPPRTAEELAELANQRRATRTPPARPIDVFGEIRRGTIEPQRSIGVNYFLDIDQFGFSLNNILLSPHIAGVTQEATIRMSKQAVQNVLDVFDGKVNPEVIINKNVL